MEKSKTSALRVLASAFDFDEQDLEANRDGYMSKRQRQRLSDSRTSCTVGLLGVSLIFSLGLYGAVQNPVKNMSTILLCIGAVVGAAYFWKRRHLLNNDLRKGYVASAQGLVRLDVRSEGKGGICYTVDLPDAHFNLTKRAFLAFKNGDPYVFYFAPYSQTLLSIEWLREC